ncbi:rod shape-determining protein [Atopomonas sediminilitoris]|uniref:rod shape-determining protein n=1 Tax=Atopomonas sediminilitoris TaxID=2919919 RepID=UPI001F4E3442|nr:rod shape-determining protein [Atopomonas sediminilitoris]MCJ8169797.1 rod shape-determining protein [Atopomonas sediminilitoris]
MLKHLLSHLNTTLYLQIWPDKIVLRNLTNNAVLEDEAVLVVDNSQAKARIVGFGHAARQKAAAHHTVISPFSHPRTLLSNFSHAETLFKLAVQAIYPKGFLKSPPFLIIHPMANTEGGLTQIERRCLRELTLCAGAKDMMLYQGEVLSAERFDLAELKRAHPNWRDD